MCSPSSKKVCHVTLEMLVLINMDKEHPGEVAEAHCCWGGRGCTCGHFTGQSLGLLHVCEEVDRCQVTAQIWSLWSLAVTEFQANLNISWLSVHRCWNGRRHRRTFYVRVFCLVDSHSEWQMFYFHCLMFCFVFLSLIKPLPGFQLTLNVPLSVCWLIFAVLA